MKKSSKANELDLRISGGKREHQKMKPFLVMDYLMRETDEQHPVSIDDIVFYLSERGIDAENKSIKSDIEEINYILYMLEQGGTVQEAVEDLNTEDYSGDKFIFQTEDHKGYYVKRRLNDVNENDIRLLAEAIYSARFLNKKNVNRLLDIISPHISKHEVHRILHDIPELERPRTANTDVYYNVISINNAMKDGTKATPHRPEKITFRYQQHKIENVEKTVDKKKTLYKVSPYKLLINEGYYYLLAFDDSSQSIRTYRIDRMKDIRATGEDRDGEEEFAAIDIRNYTQRVFGMFGGQRTLIVLRFAAHLLDTVIDRFGTKNVKYKIDDEEHFLFSAEVELSGQFYAWLCGFSDSVKIVSPSAAIEGFTAYLDNIRAIY